MMDAAAPPPLHPLLHLNQSDFLWQINWKKLEVSNKVRTQFSNLTQIQPREGEAKYLDSGYLTSSDEMSAAKIQNATDKMASYTAQRANPDNKVTFVLQLVQTKKKW